MQPLRMEYYNPDHSKGLESCILEIMIRSQRGWQILSVALLLLLILGCGKEETNTVLKYAFCPSPCTTSTNWIKVTVDTAEEAGQHTSLAMFADRPSISYYDASKKDLRYATCTQDCGTDSPQWSLFTIDETGDVGLYTSLKIDSIGNLHINYYDAIGQDLRYATGSPMSGGILIVSSDGDVGQYASLALSEDDKPHIAFYNRTTGTIWYAFCDGTDCLSPSDWKATEVDSIGAIPTTVERAISLVLDEDGNARIAYYDVAGGKNLKYAFCKASCEQTVSWVKSTADNSENDVGQYPSLVLDGDNIPTISYYDATTGDLKVVSCTDQCDGAQPVWPTRTVVDSAGTVGLFSSLIHDEADALQIGYYELSFDALKYAFCQTSCSDSFNWRTMTVDNPGAGRFASLAVTSNNSPAISYWAEE